MADMATTSSTCSLLLPTHLEVDLHTMAAIGVLDPDAGQVVVAQAKHDHARDAVLVIELGHNLPGE